ncbi:MAG: hypothetical protein QM605_15755 [Sphingobium sp.]
MAAMILAAIALQTAPQIYHPLLTFSAHPELRRVTTRVEVGLLANGHGEKHYWFRRTVQADGSQIAETSWTDSRSCPESRTSLEELTALEGPRPHIYGLDDTEGIMVTTDGVTYRLEAESAPPYGNGRILLQPNVETPLARWVEKALARLSGCWKENQPVR